MLIITLGNRKHEQDYKKTGILTAAAELKGRISPSTLNSFVCFAPCAPSVVVVCCG